MAVKHREFAPRAGNGAVTAGRGTSDTVPVSGLLMDAQDINYIVALQAQVENAELRQSLAMAWQTVGILLEMLEPARPKQRPWQWWKGQP